MNIKPLLIVVLLATALLLAVLLLPVTMWLPLLRRLNQHRHQEVLAGTANGKVLIWTRTAS